MLNGIETADGLRLERRKSLAEQISDTLVEAIGLGMIKPGARVVETEIAARFEVSRVPVREALKILSTQGILEGESHRGLYVMAVDDVAIEQICSARLAVESLAIDAIVSSPERLAELDAALTMRIGALEAEIARKDLIAINREDLAFHSEICLLSGNKIAWTLWQAISRHVRIVFGREILSEKAIVTMVAEHQALKAAILSADREVIYPTLRQHIFRKVSDIG
ncbi:GntR family transcriptional regulator [Devosia faecipullorum]|uniref:GntR family transcriptional regulator n=1 Tax=Devosia faecipullorum TaxID=2755039 RepID=UPI00187B9236|nr:GntR family transcriptional regulator [Devosia faecipullorum]MBE7733334.1 GntR family transcriptional regulator [Devosia faecipullorum]